MPLADLSAIQRIAVAHAKPHLREIWALLLEFDNRLMAIAAKVQEPVLKQLRLAWWREQLGKNAAVRPKGEPLLARLAAAPAELGLEQSMLDLVDAWECLLADDEDPPVDDRAIELRAKAVFGSYAAWAGAGTDDAAKALDAGKLWAAASTGPQFSIPRPQLLPGLKPLNLLLMATLLDRSDSRRDRIIGSVRINFHALTGL